MTIYECVSTRHDIDIAYTYPRTMPIVWLLRIIGLKELALATPMLVINEDCGSPITDKVALHPLRALATTSNK